MNTFAFFVLLARGTGIIEFLQLLFAFLLILWFPDISMTEKKNITQALSPSCKCCFGLLDAMEYLEAQKKFSIWVMNY